MRNAIQGNDLNIGIFSGVGEERIFCGTTQFLYTNLISP